MAIPSWRWPDLKVSEALKITQGAPVAGEPFNVVLACGFTPLHVELFLRAHIQRRLADRKVNVQTGLYGNLIDTIDRAHQLPLAHSLVVCLEWADLDPRLGYRRLGGWGPAQETDAVVQVEASLERLRQSLHQLAVGTRVVLSTPTLPLPPLFHIGEWQLAATGARIQAILTNFVADLTQAGKVAIVNPQHLAELSPPAQRFDLKSELLNGLPYSLPHADVLTGIMARLVAPAPPKKGLITDLDDTFWKGILGEVGVTGVSWDLSQHNQIHGLYQQLLSALADQGILVAVASKNDPNLVQKAFERTDLIIAKEKIFPFEVHWNAKSGSVRQVLTVWNIGAGDVIFVDDSPMELAEVQAAHPAVDCRRFPTNDYAAAVTFLRDLRSAFGKERISAEDSIRSSSLRQGAQFSTALDQAGASDEFLERLSAEITVETHAAGDPRTLELVNKTNQFNMNGRRIDSMEWQQATTELGAIVWAISYRDKFGPLGKIAVLAGRQDGSNVHLNQWVMSCRAFARRIEHQCLKLLFEHSGANAITLDFQKTERNGPFQDFLTTIGKDLSAPVLTLHRSDLDGSRLPLHHQVHWSPPE